MKIQFNHLIIEITLIIQEMCLNICDIGMVNRRPDTDVSDTKDSLSIEVR